LPVREIAFKNACIGMKKKIFNISYHGGVFELAARHRSAGSDLIFFIHGLGCSKESFEDVFGLSQFTDFQLLAVDLVGYGDSSKPRDFTYSMEDQARLLGLLLQNITHSRIHIVAHSMGGAIGLLLKEDLRNELASFVNIEGNMIGEDCGLVSRKTTTVSFEEFRDNIFDRIRNNGPEPWKELSVKSDALGFYRSCESLVEWSDSGKLLDMYLHLETTKAYVYGEQNADMEILERLGDARKIAIPGSGHFVMNDNPAEFYRRLYEIVTEAKKRM
jgi:pimeloyl-ACP methyl ester carboxylesterase